MLANFDKYYGIYHLVRNTFLTSKCQKLRFKDIFFLKNYHVSFCLT